MEILQELEKRIKKIVEVSKEQAIAIERLLAENESLKETNRLLEETLLKESESVVQLSEEKELIKDAVDDILSTIALLEESQSQQQAV